MPAKQHIPIQLLNLEDGYHLLIKIKINGKPARVLIDTGASKTVFDKTQIKKFIADEKFEAYDHLSAGLGTSNMKSEWIILKSLLIGKKEIKNYKTVVLNLSHVNNSYAQLNHQPIDGVLGSDLLKKHKAVIDYGKKVLLLF